MRPSSDFLIVGAGSAGCVLSRRLAEAGRTVTLIEAGKSNRNRWDSWTIHMPAALTYNVADKRYNYDYHTVPQTHLNHRRIHEPRGKVLGGSSSINAMVYVRGHALDFERWAKQEGAGDDWSYAHVLPYFKRAQAHAKGANEYRGGNGPLKVKAMDPDQDEVTNVLFRTFRDGGIQAGYPKTTDINGFQQEGFGPFDMTIDPASGKRHSTAEAYLHPALASSASKNLNVLTNRFVTKINFKDKRATGVTLDDGQVLTAGEVIISGGAINSPQLLMLSGIGPQKHLESLDIPVVLDSPHVGQNLQDHLEVYAQYLCEKPVTLYPVGNWTLRYLHKRIGVGLQWFALGKGIGASNQFETGGFIRSRAGIEHPDIQYHFIPGAVLGQLDFLPYHAFQVHVGTLRPSSRGTVKLASKDPKAEPLIDPNFLGTEMDRMDMRNAMRLADEIVQQKAFDEYRGARIRPTLEEMKDLNDDTVLDAWIRQSSHSAYHPSCTLAMGKVVDGSGLVHGVSGLRVVDASIMPSMTSGNLNAPIIMMAEKISDKILGVEPLKPEFGTGFYRAKSWEVKQR